MPVSHRPTILCLASYEKGADFMRACKAQGWRVLLLTRSSLQDAEAWPRDVIDDFFYIDDMYNRDIMIAGVSYLARSEPIDSIAALDDFDVEMAATLREHLRLPGIGESQARLFRDKLAMRVSARDAGIRVPEFVHVLNDAAINEYLERVPPPWLIKPRSQASAVGIKRMSYRDDVWKAIDSLGDQRAAYLIEHYIPGTVYHVDTLVVDRTIVFAEAHRYGTPPLDVMHGGGIFISSTLPRGTQEEQAVHALNQRLVAALGLQDGVMHTEFIGGADGQFYFLETAARVAGANLADLVEAATGINLWGEWAAIKLRGERSYTLPQPRSNYGGIIVCLARQEYPDTSGYQDPEIVWRLNKHHHAGLIITSPDYDRVAALLDHYARRFAEDFLAVVPAPEQPTS